MRSVGSPSVIRVASMSVITLSTAALSQFGCSDGGPVRTSGNKDGTGAFSGSDGSGGSSSGSTGSPGGTGTQTGGTGTAGTDPGSGGTAASAGTGSAGDTSGSGSTSGSGGATTGAGGSGNAGGSAGSTADGGTGPCQMANYTFAPKIPTVFMLVNMSGSMWDCQIAGPTDPEGRGCADHDNTSWYPLREGALQLIEALQADVRFGFSAFAGEIGDVLCPDMTPVTPDFNNYEAIATQYNAFLPPEKGETPTSKALAEVGEILLADDSPGDRFILFVTDGDPDYCSDGDGICPADSAVYQLQTLAAAGIRTLVFGLPAPASVTQAGESILAAFANAGAGEPVARVGNSTEFTLWDECNFKVPWADDFALTGKPVERGGEIATFSEVGGTATVFRPEATNQQALVDLLSAALSGVKSCTFDLSNVNGQSIKVDLNKLAEASVAIQGVTVPQDATNGWSMASQTQLLLTGTACDTWRTPESTDIAFNFPCNTIIFE